MFPTLFGFEDTCVRTRVLTSTAVEIPRMTDLIRMPFSDFRYFREKFEEKKKKSLKKQDFHFEVAQI